MNNDQHHAFFYRPCFAGANSCNKILSSLFERSLSKLSAQIRLNPVVAKWAERLSNFSTVNFI